MIDLNHLDGFDWEDGNRDKNWLKHSVTYGECEETFFNIPRLLQTDPTHSQNEARYYALGHTHAGRNLFIGFTIRNTKIRIISARDMNQKERSFYAQANS